jgi:hypothetical protein
MDVKTRRYGQMWSETRLCEFSPKG